MRALILLESLLVIALALLILLVGPPTVNPADSHLIFPAQNFIGNARPGEHVRYTVDSTGRGIEYSVGDVSLGSPSSPPSVQIGRQMTDELGRVEPDSAPVYVHLLHRHGLFPFLAQEVPSAYDRVWILKRIRFEEMPWRGKQIRCWHVDCIDPGLPPERSAVELWMHEDVPVFGIVRWQHDGHSYESDWRPK